MPRPPQHRAATLATILFIYVIPVALIHAGVVPFRYRFVVLLLLASVAVIISVGRDYSLQRLGIRRPDSVQTVIGVVVPSAVLLLANVAGLILAEEIAEQTTAFYVFFVFVSAPAQEFLYRSVLISELESAGQVGVWPRVLTSAALYAAMHSIYLDWTVVGVTFAAGVLWGSMFVRYRNVGTVAVSHACVGALAIALGLV